MALLSKPVITSRLRDDECEFNSGLKLFILCDNVDDFVRRYSIVKIPLFCAPSNLSKRFSSTLECVYTLSEEKWNKNLILSFYWVLIDFLLCSLTANVIFISAQNVLFFCVDSFLPMVRAVMMIDIGPDSLHFIYFRLKGRVNHDVAID